MRQITLPAPNTISFTLSAAELQSSGILMPDGHRHISMGKVEPEDFESLKIARLNGSTILWATICLEQKIERIIVNYFMGPFDGPSQKRHLFENEVIRSASFQLGFKKQLLEKISNELRVPFGKQRNKLQGALKKIIFWRNAFAHGHLKLNAQRGVVLCFYAGSHQEQVLDEDFWCAVEKTYEECDGMLNELETVTTSKVK